MCYMCGPLATRRPATTPEGVCVRSRGTTMKHLLIVDRNPHFRRLLQETMWTSADVQAVAELRTAQEALRRVPVDLVVVNAWFGGDDVVKFARSTMAGGRPPRVVAYGDAIEPPLARALQRVGAFCESRARIRYALPAYFAADLPVLDRRNPELPDRRYAYRGGRRASDIPTIIGLR